MVTVRCSLKGKFFYYARILSINKFGLMGTLMVYSVCPNRTLQKILPTRRKPQLVGLALGKCFLFEPSRISPAGQNELLRCWL